MGDADALAALQERIDDDAERLRGEGVIVGGMWSSDDRARVVAEVIAADAETARRVMRDHYGDSVEIDYLGPDETASEAAPWSRYAVDAPDRLTVFFKLSSIERRLDRIDLAESDDEVTITVFERYRVGGGEKMPGVPEHAETVRLQRPLAGRRVVDGATGETRPPPDG